ncbi:MAG: diacylglycerol kinase family lipid kinase, partial [Clostridia bacterium]|nr:diacylglycerol kinase family lipid kinase [Clostridia bacterium]
GRGAKCLAAVETYLKEHNVSYTVHKTEHVGHGKELAQQLCQSGSQIIVALGGDGTFHEVLNGMDFSKARMGLIPAGRGNDFAIGAHAASLDPTKAIADIVRGETKDLDYIQIADKRCANVAGTGLDIEVLLKTANSKNKLSYAASLVRCVLNFKPYDVEVTLDGQTTPYKCIMIGVCNGTQIGGGMKISPLSNASDGKLDVVVIEKPKHTPTLFMVPTFTKGKHMNKSFVHHVICDSVKITTPAPIQLDGEIYYDLSFDASIVAGGLKTFATSD